MKEALVYCCGVIKEDRIQKEREKERGKNS
jgi:hypothetical protein